MHSLRFWGLHSIHSHVYQKREKPVSSTLHKICKISDCGWKYKTEEKTGILRNLPQDCHFARIFTNFKDFVGELLVLEDFWEGIHEVKYQEFPGGQNFRIF